MTILDIDIDAFYPTYIGDIHTVNAIDKSTDEFNKELFDRFAAALTIRKDAIVLVGRDHDYVYYSLADWRKGSEEESIIHIHVDAHTDRLESDKPVSGEPTLANWVSHSMARDLTTELICFHADKKIKNEDSFPLYTNGRRVWLSSQSLYFSDFGILKDKVIDRIYFTQSPEWCNYSDSTLIYMKQKLGVQENNG